MGLRGGHEADVGLEKVEKEVSTVNSELESNLIIYKQKRYYYDTYSIIQELGPGIRIVRYN